MCIIACEVPVQSVAKTVYLPIPPVQIAGALRRDIRHSHLGGHTAHHGVVQGAEHGGHRLAALRPHRSTATATATIATRANVTTTATNTNTAIAVKLPRRKQVHLTVESSHRVCRITRVLRRYSAQRPH